MKREAQDKCVVQQPHLWVKAQTERKQGSDGHLLTLVHGRVNHNYQKVSVEG